MSETGSEQFSITPFDPDNPDMMCEFCGGQISADTRRCVKCGASMLIVEIPSLDERALERYRACLRRLNAS